ncbi:MAG: hypothetical protein AAFN70_16695 [Planctomycetota bacterium]
MQTLDELFDHVRSSGFDQGTRGNHAARPNHAAQSDPAVGSDSPHSTVDHRSSISCALVADTLRSLRREIAMRVTFVCLIMIGSASAAWFSQSLGLGELLEFIQSFDLDGFENVQTVIQVLRVFYISLILGFGALLMLTLMAWTGRFWIAERALDFVPIAGAGLRGIDLAEGGLCVWARLEQEESYRAALEGASRQARAARMRSWLRDAAHTINQGRAMDDAIAGLKMQAGLMPMYISSAFPDGGRPGISWGLAIEHCTKVAKANLALLRNLAMPIAVVFAAMVAWSSLALSLNLFSAVISVIGELT